ncbi:MAG TPA: hypothetical protein VGT99_11750 [Gammaproteobacteria bacterium]|nr:hypothetical protein [Gammaproteobacteria bacterium]
MAIRLQFINLIIPVATLERLLAPEESGFLRAEDPSLGDMVWHDAYLCRIEGAMNWADVEEMVARWEARGLQGLVGASPQQWWKGFAVCASRRGATFPCDWLVYDAADNCVHLAGTPKGEIAGPRPLS